MKVVCTVIRGHIVEAHREKMTELSSSSLLLNESSEIDSNALHFITDDGKKKLKGDQDGDEDSWSRPTSVDEAEEEEEDEKSDDEETKLAKSMSLLAFEEEKRNQKMKKLYSIFRDTVSENNSQVLFLPSLSPSSFSSSFTILSSCC